MRKKNKVIYCMGPSAPPQSCQHQRVSAITDGLYSPPKILKPPHKMSQPRETMTFPVTRGFLTPSQRQDRLRALEGITGLERLPPLHAARLNADHVLIAVLGRKVANPGGLLGPGVPHHEVGQIVANDRVDGLAALGDLDRLTRALGGRVDAICLAGDGDVGRLRLDLQCVDLVDVL